MRPRVTRRLAGAVVAAVAACAQPAASEDPPAAAAAAGIPAEPPSIRGVITAVHDDRLRIEANPAEAWGSDKAMVRLTAGTRILRRDGGTATRADLTAGRPASAWFTGPVLESYPVQATASAILLER